jgi:hypothetical protein
MSAADDLSGIVDAAVEISERRRETLATMKEALERGDSEEALEYARQLCGIDDEESDRTNQSVH